MFGCGRAEQMCMLWWYFRRTTFASPGSSLGFHLHQLMVRASISPLALNMRILHACTAADATTNAVVRVISPPPPELARALHFQTFHDGEVLFHQGDAIVDTSARFLVVQGSLFVYKSMGYATHARNGEDYAQWFVTANPEVTRDAVKYGDCIGTCGVGDTCGDVSAKPTLIHEHILSKLVH